MSKVHIGREAGRQLHTVPVFSMPSRVFAVSFPPTGCPPPSPRPAGCWTGWRAAPCACWPAPSRPTWGIWPTTMAASGTAVRGCWDGQRRHVDAGMQESMTTQSSTAHGMLPAKVSC